MPMGHSLYPGDKMDTFCELDLGDSFKTYLCIVKHKHVFLTGITIQEV